MKARLIVADSEHDANMLYATGFFVPDPFIFFEFRGKTFAVLSDLEIDRAKKESTIDRVLSYTKYQKQLIRAGIREPTLSDVLNRVLHEQRVRSVEVPSNFPLGLAKKLRKVRVSVKPDPFFPERELKTKQEIADLCAALRLSEMGMAAAIDVLRMTRMARDGFLYRGSRKVTSEDIQGLINATIADRGGSASHTIVACGNQACDPHEPGHGPLRANTPIIIDIFPRDTTTGYYGDITRTVVRGRAAEKVREMHALVAKAQEIAFKMLKPGVNGKEVHETIQKLFRSDGFQTKRVRGRMQGFFHGTGHGLGLDIHEPPRIAAVSRKLRAGHVVTVEPGLYYWGVGGVRLEDVAAIGENGAKNLTRFPKRLEI